MTIGDALFARFSIRSMNAVGLEIATLQERVSSGLNDPRASADPTRATELSALRDVRARLDTREAVGRSAADRLAFTDQTLESLSENLRQLKEITLRAANDTLTSEAHAALRMEAVTLRDAMLSAANAKDMTGRPLFSGTSPGPAFVETSEGVVYRGNDAVTLSQIGERGNLATSLSGRQVFGEDEQNVFRILDDTIASLTEPMLSARPVVRAQSPAELDIVRTRGDASLDVVLTGPLGASPVRLGLRIDAPGETVAAINAQSAVTGVIAELGTDGKAIRLRADGEVSLSAQTGGDRTRPTLTLGAVQENGQPAGPVTGLRPTALTANALVADAGLAVDHMATMRAAAGSLAAEMDRQLEALAKQRLTVDQSVSKLQDLDVAATLTKLQSLLMTEQASQMTFVKIVGQSLFSYLR